MKRGEKGALARKAAVEARADAAAAERAATGTPQTLADQLSREIMERSDYVEEMRRLGIGGEDVRRVEFEIQTRKAQLETMI